MAERLVCIVCPVGCDLELSVRSDEVLVEGNRCPKGFDYAAAEAIDPRRTLTTTLPVAGGSERLVPVRVDRVPRGRMLEAMGTLRRMSVAAPAPIGSRVGTIRIGDEELPVVTTAAVERAR